LARFEREVVTTIWPEALALMDYYALQWHSTKSAVARLAIYQYREASQDYKPEESRPLPTHRLLARIYSDSNQYGYWRLRKFSFKPDFGTRLWLGNYVETGQADSYREVLRRVIGYQVNFLDAEYS